MGVISFGVSGRFPRCTVQLAGPPTSGFSGPPDILRKYLAYVQSRIADGNLPGSRGTRECQELVLRDEKDHYNAGPEGRGFTGCGKTGFSRQPPRRPARHPSSSEEGSFGALPSWFRRGGAPSDGVVAIVVPPGARDFFRSLFSPDSHQDFGRAGLKPRPPTRYNAQLRHKALAPCADCGVEAFIPAFWAARWNCIRLRRLVHNPPRERFP